MSTLLFATDAHSTLLSQLLDGGVLPLAHDAYGHRAATDELATVMGFNGQLREAATGWYHLGNGHRVYNPALRRFHSPDRLSPFAAGGINAYAYCEGDPVNFTDPTGRAISWGSPSFSIIFHSVLIAVNVLTIGIAVGASVASQIAVQTATTVANGLMPALQVATAVASPTVSSAVSASAAVAAATTAGATLATAIATANKPLMPPLNQLSTTLSMLGSPTTIVGQSMQLMGVRGGVEVSWAGTGLSILSGATRLFDAGQKSSVAFSQFRQARAALAAARLGPRFTTEVFAAPTTVVSAAAIRDISASLSGGAIQIGFPVGLHV
jgi:RHS repeat-associated protein